MKIKEIIPGKTYKVQIPDEVDQIVHGQAYRGEVTAIVVDVGVPRKVVSYSGSRVHGDRGYRREHDSAYLDGVRVTWEDQEVQWRYGRGRQRTTHVHSGSGIIPARNVRFSYDPA